MRIFLLLLILCCSCSEILKEDPRTEYKINIMYRGVGIDQNIILVSENTKIEDIIVEGRIVKDVIMFYDGKIISKIPHISDNKVHTLSFAISLEEVGLSVNDKIKKGEGEEIINKTYIINK